jgi:hypothetical protein
MSPWKEPAWRVPQPSIGWQLVFVAALCLFVFVTRLYRDQISAAIHSAFSN